jgi:hypothetical protein
MSLSSLSTRSTPKHRADFPTARPGWSSRLARPAVLLLAGGFVLVGGGNLELGPVEARVGLASAEPLGPYGRAFGYWDPSTWPLAVALGRVWTYFEETGPTQGAVRWPAAIAGVILGILLARRMRSMLGNRASVLLAMAWFGSLALIDRSNGAGLDLVAGLGTVAALDRLIARGSGWVAGCWAGLAFLGGGLPPLAVIGLSTVVLGRGKATWGWTMTVPVAAAVVGWMTWALASSPAQAMATALLLPIKQGSAWWLIPATLGLACPWAPFALLCRSTSVREAWPETARSYVVGWIQVASACLLVGTVIPGVSTAAIVPALAGLAIAAAAAWDRVCDRGVDLGRARTGAAWLTALLASAWFVLVLAWGGYLGFAVAYYRGLMIVLGCVSLGAWLAAVRGIRLSEPRWSLVSVFVVAVALKLAHWGYFVPEYNYRAGAGPWGRAIGQWIPEKHPVYVLHPWPAELAFAIGRPVRQLSGPKHLPFTPGEGSKFVLLADSEYAEYEHWSQGWPRLIKVAEFEDETGLGRRILTRTDAPLILERPYKPASTD